MIGKIDKDDTMVGAYAAKLTSIAEDASGGCLLRVGAEPHAEAFDFDLTSKTPVEATRAKLIKFFDVTADEKADMTKHFDQDGVGAINPDSSVKVVRVVKRLKGERNFEVRLPFFMLFT